jgi:hypothetical protein
MKKIKQRKEQKFTACLARRGRPLQSYSLSYASRFLTTTRQGVGSLAPPRFSAVVAA